MAILTVFNHTTKNVGLNASKLPGGFLSEFVVPAGRSCVVMEDTEPNIRAYLAHNNNPGLINAKELVHRPHEKLFYTITEPCAPEPAPEPVADPTPVAPSAPATVTIAENRAG